MHDKHKCRLYEDGGRDWNDAATSQKMTRNVGSNQKLEKARNRVFLILDFYPSEL